MPCPKSFQFYITLTNHGQLIKNSFLIIQQTKGYSMDSPKVLIESHETTCSMEWLSEPSDIPIASIIIMEVQIKVFATGKLLKFMFKSRHIPNLDTVGNREGKNDIASFILIENTAVLPYHKAIIRLNCEMELEIEIVREGK